MKKKNQVYLDGWYLWASTNGDRSVWCRFRSGLETATCPLSHLLDFDTLTYRLRQPFFEQIFSWL